MKDNQTKKSLRTSGLALLLCVTMLIGTTFAWFTDSITNSGNKIQSGTLDIGAKAYAVGQGGTKVTITGVNGDQAITFSQTGADLEKSKDPIINDSLWEPGKSSAKLLEVTNNGSLAAKVKLAFQVTDGSLQNALWFDFVQVDANGTATGTFTKRPMNQLATVADGVEVSLSAKNSVRFVLVYGMDETAGNEYQGKTFTADVTINATQFSEEKDGFGNADYDKNATYPVSDITEFEDALNQAQDGDTIQLTGNLKLEKVMSINKNLTIDGNGNTIISEKPVYVGAKNDVAIANVEFTSPKNASNNASSLYAEGLEGKLTLKNCRFVDFQWEGVQITPKAGANIVVDNCYFSNSKTMKNSGITTNRYFHVEVADGTTDINQIHLQLTNNTFKNVVWSAAGGDGYFKDSAVTSYGIPKENITCSGNVFTGVVQEDALNNPSIIWMSNGFKANELMYDGFLIKK